jgi:peroxiredoxin
VLEGRGKREEGRGKREEASTFAPISHLPSPILLLLLWFFLFSFSAQAAESYVITIQKLELKRVDGSWVKIIEPDYRVDLASTEAVVSFFNNGRVPNADFNNFRINFEDHGVEKQMTRFEDFRPSLRVKKGSFVRVSFDLDLATKQVKELRLNVDDAGRVDSQEQIKLKDKNMALTPSTMTKLGSKVPDFTLKDVVTGDRVSLSSFKTKKALLVLFICRHCPYVQHIKEELSRLDRDYRQKDIALVAISSNDAVNYPEDAPVSLKEFAREIRWQSAFLYDETQAVAKEFTAACTPDLFLYDAQRSLVYRGQLDDSRPGNGKPSNGKDIRAAMDAVLSDKPVSSEQKASIGCNIKWKQEP